MKKLFTVLLIALIAFSFQSNDDHDYNFQSGEYIKYKVHSGIINAGIAEITVKDTKIDNESHFHVVGNGRTTGVVDAMYRIRDRYETFINKNNAKPTKFIRKINEGGYTKDLELHFDHDNNTVKMNDFKRNKTKTFEVKEPSIQDMLSAFYYLRDYNTDDLKAGDHIDLKIFMDEEIYPFKLKILGREKVRTKFGKIKTIKIRPLVPSGRVFKAKESVTIWVTDDKNHVPVTIKAKLIAVVSLRADLHSFKNLKYPLEFK